MSLATVPAVKLSLKSDYAARAVLALARHYPTGKPRRVEDIAAEQGMPPKYLVQILIELKSSQIVRSLRGKVGGYMLARPPAEISLGDVLRAVHGEVFSAAGLESANCPPEIRAAWLRLQQAVDTAASLITFQQLLEQAQDKAKMYYI
jgi:Rrf2 family cysteine metabolism transcriptional repressor